ncbi:MAG TPA: hypothetical protein VFH61_18440 [Thermoleophilia bacterium]|nr:hypothetical protein [Thermoleophilia bacterium]
MPIPISLELDEIGLILLHLPDDSITHDLRIRLKTIVEVAPHMMGVLYTAPDRAPVSTEVDPLRTLTAPLDFGEDEPFEPSPWPTNLPPLRGTPPYGWRRHGEKLVPALEEADVMIRVLQGRKRGWSYTQIANDLNSRQLFSRNGSRWTSSGTSRIHKKSCEHRANASIKARYE